MLPQWFHPTDLHWFLPLVDTNEMAMDPARPFRSRRSEAVQRDLPVDDPWATLKAGLESFEPGFVIERHQPEEHAGDQQHA